MLSPELNHLVYLEQHKDRLRSLEHQRLLQAARVQPTINWEPHRKTLSWLGAQMVKWGTKLQSHDTTSPSDAIIIKT